MEPGQDALIESLFRANYDLLVKYACSKLENPSRAEEAVQDTFHEAVLHIDALMGHPNPRGWLLQTLKYKILKSERERIRYLRRFLSMDSEFPPECSAPGDAYASIAENDALEDKLKRSLSPEEIYQLKRFVFDKAGHQEIAAELGVSLWAAQKRMERIRKRLSTAFEK